VPSIAPAHPDPGCVNVLRWLPLIGDEVLAADRDGRAVPAAWLCDRPEGDRPRSGEALRVERAAVAATVRPPSAVDTWRTASWRIRGVTTMVTKLLGPRTRNVLDERRASAVPAQVAGRQVLPTRDVLGDRAAMQVEPGAGLTRQMPIEPVRSPFDRPRAETVPVLSDRGRPAAVPNRFDERISATARSGEAGLTLDRPQTPAARNPLDERRATGPTAPPADRRAGTVEPSVTALRAEAPATLARPPRPSVAAEPVASKGVLAPPQPHAVTPQDGPNSSPDVRELTDSRVSTPLDERRAAGPASATDLDALVDRRAASSPPNPLDERAARTPLTSGGSPLDRKPTGAAPAGLDSRRPAGVPPEGDAGPAAGEVLDSVREKAGPPVNPIEAARGPAR